MKSVRQYPRKLYALFRMRNAIDRAMKATTSEEQLFASRWAGAWGLLGGIRIRGTRLRLRRNRLVGKE